MNKMEIKIDGVKYTIKTERTKSNSNYNTFLSVFEEDDKTPIWGTTIKDTDTNDLIVSLALMGIKSYQNQPCVL